MRRIILLMPMLLIHLACSAGPAISVRVDPSGGELTVADHRTHQEWRQRRLAIGPVPSQRVVASGGDETVLDCQLPAANRQRAPVLAHVRLTLKVVGDDLHLTFEHLDPDRELYAIEYPYAFVPPFEDAFTLYPHGEGMLVPARTYASGYMTLPDSEMPGVYSGLGAYMACLGLVSPATGQGLLTIFDSPELSGYGFHPVGDLSLATIRIAADKYRVDRPRNFILHFSAGGGYVALAERYRKYFSETGRHVTLAEKESNAIGSSIFWLHGAPAEIAAIAKEMPEAGVRRAVVGIQNPDVVRGDPPAGLSDAIREINAHGYLASRYDQYRDCFKTDPAVDGYEQINHAAWPDSVVRMEDGSMLAGFGPHSGVISPDVGLALAKARIPADLKAHPYAARFMDCYGSVGFGEGVDWSAAHPSEVYRARAAREKTLAFTRSLGLAVGTECGNDYLLPWLDWVEGPMTLVRWSGLDVGDGPKPPGKDYTVSISPRYRIPFYSLAHHDEVVITWRWEDGFGAVPGFDVDKKLWCVLYGNPPMHFTSKENWPARKAMVRQLEDEIGEWIRLVSGKRMVSHRFVTADHAVQETTFEGGWTATVNFRSEPYRMADGTVLPANGWMTRKRS